jgi:hypothetical protein
MKKQIEDNFSFFASKNNLIVSLCIFFILYVWLNIKLFIIWHDIKLLLKYKKYSLTGFKFLDFKNILIISYTIKIIIKLFIIHQFSNN